MNVVEQVSIPQYHDPNRFGYREHHTLTAQYGSELRRVLERVTEVVMEPAEGSRYLVHTVGSDARREKGPVSPVELSIYTDDDTYAEEVVTRVMHFAEKHTDARFLDRNIEWRNVDRVKPADFELLSNEGKKVTLKSPNRIYDAVPLYGDMSLRSKQLELFQEEAMAPRGKRVLDHLKRRLRSHLETTLTGEQRYKGEVISHFDPSSGKLWYDDTTRWGTKQGPLRAVQYALARDKYRMTRDGVDVEVIADLPRNTVEQVDCLDELASRTVSREALSSVQDHYTFFQWLYHRSQYAHRWEDEEVVSHDSVELERRSRDLVDILEEPTYVFER
jgi:hypothetical protein